MDESTIRITRLKQLMSDEYENKQRLLAEKLERQPDYISRLFHGKKKLGADLARTFESLLGKPKYWLDGVDTLIEPQRSAQEFAQERDAYNVAPGPEIRGQVPLISWVQAGDFCETQDPLSPGDAEKWLACPVPHGSHTYCLRVIGRSMDSEDGYREGEIIFVDPDVEARPNKDVIVRTPDGESTFKRLKKDIDGYYLLALNPKWEPNYMKMPDGSHICGVVIFAGRER
jgi:SOS-response transcriptional repressor LexA